MKTLKNILFVVLVVLPFLSFAPKVTNDGYYAFIVVDGVWKDGTGYTSSVIYYPGYSNCNSNRDIDFFNEAKRSFSSHLKAYHNSAFPYGENNNFQIITAKLHSTGYNLNTLSQAQQRMTEWIADQKGKGYQVVNTNFNFSCANL